jgi:hypothetical protein
MRPKTQTRKPPSVKPNTHCHDVCNGANEINRNFCHIPAQPSQAKPSQAIAISNAPTIKQAKTMSAFPILFSSLSSLEYYLIEDLHDML